MHKIHRKMHDRDTYIKWWFKEKKKTYTHRRISSNGSTEKRFQDADDVKEVNSLKNSKPSLFVDFVNFRFGSAYKMFM